MNWTEELMQLALTNHVDAKFFFRRWIVVPNVSHGMYGIIHPGREVDLLCVSGSRLAHAVEIKVSASDLRAEAKKHWRNGSMKWHNIRCEWLAVPQNLTELALELAAPGTGVIEVSHGHSDEIWSRNRVIREPLVNHDACKLTDKEMSKLLFLGMMRMWSRRKLQYCTQTTNHRTSETP